VGGSAGRLAGRLPPLVKTYGLAGRAVHAVGSCGPRGPRGENTRSKQHCPELFNQERMKRICNMTKARLGRS
jgi:hypothetical protein